MTSDEIKKKLDAIPDLNLYEVIAYFHDKQLQEDLAICQAAQESLHQDEICEIDNNTVLSRAPGDPENGTYILAWSWFPFEGTEWDKNVEPTKRAVIAARKKAHVKE